MPLAKIILPESNGKIKTTNGTVIMVGGVELGGVSRIEIDLNPNEVLEAKITLAIDDVETLDYLNAIISEDNFKEVAEMCGYELVKRS